MTSYPSSIGPLDYLKQTLFEEELDNVRALQDMGIQINGMSYIEAVIGLGQEIHSLQTVGDIKKYLLEIGTLPEEVDSEIQTLWNMSLAINN